MSNAEEVLITSCKTSLQVWSSQGSGSMNNIHTYKNNGEIVPNSLNLINNRLVATAHQGKPLLHIWPVNSPDEIKNPRFVLPGPANVFRVTADGHYLVAGINRTLYIWQVSSGILLTAQEVHLCAITCIAISQDCGHVVVGAANGCVLVYNFAHLVSVEDAHYAQTSLGKVKPLHNLLDHTNAVTEVHIVNRRFLTCSLDHGCFVYDLRTGRPRLRVVCDDPITSMVVDAPLWNVYFGHATGDIFQFSLENSGSVHFTSPGAELRFGGHASRVNCLDLNRTNELLVSGSDDHCVIVWSVESKQILNRLELKSPVTNVRFLLNANTFDPHVQPRFVVKELQRTLEGNAYKSFECEVYQDTSFEGESEDVDWEEIDDLRRRLHLASRVNYCLVKRLKSGTP